jgi:hypothetical protein
MNKIFKFRSLGILMFLATIAVFSVAAMFLWNALMPGIFALPVLSYWQAAGLVVLARILFGGLGPGRLGAFGGRGGDDRLFAHGNALREKWLNMSDDERMEFVRNHRGFRNHPFFDDAPGGSEGKKE